MLIQPASRLFFPPDGVSFREGGGGGFDLANYIKNTYAPVALWPLGDLTGTVATETVSGLNGTYENVTLNNAAGPNGHKRVPLFVPASLSNVDVYSTGLNTAFDGDEGTLLCFVKALNSTIMTDGTRGWFVKFSADATNTVEMYNDNQAVGRIIWRRLSGGSDKIRTGDFGNVFGWMQVAIVWSKAGNYVRAVHNGAQVGADLTTFNSWVGNLNATTTALGSTNNSGTTPWSGWLGFYALFDTPLTIANLRDIYIQSGVTGPTIYWTGDSKGDLPKNNLRNLLFSLQTEYYLGVGTNYTGNTVAQYATDIAARVVTAGTLLPVGRTAYTYIFVNLGANDVVAIPAEATWLANYRTLIAGYHAIYPNAAIYLVKPWRRSYGTECNTLATRIDTLAAEETHVYVGIDERTVIENGDDGVTMTSDGIHPNAAGWAASATAWIAVLGL